MRKISGILDSWKYIFTIITQNATPLHKNLYPEHLHNDGLEQEVSFSAGLSLRRLKPNWELGFILLPVLIIRSSLGWGSMMHTPTKTPSHSWYDLARRQIPDEWQV
jgi:hypothetical protein